MSGTIFEINYKNKLLMKNFIKVLSLVAAGLTVSQAADAQIVYPYTVDFETATTTPSSKSYNSNDTIVANGGKWTMPGVFLGTMQPVATEFRNGTFSARVRSVDNPTPVSQAIMTLHTDLPLGADSLKFSYAKYGSDLESKFFVQYSINQGSSWNIIGDTVTVNGAAAVPSVFAAHVNQTSPIRFRIIKVNATTARFNIDDIRVTPAAQATNISLTNNTPTGTIFPSVDAMTLTFNEDVVAGTGNVTLHEVGGTPVVFDVTTSQDITIVNNVVTIDNVTLAPSKSYFVTFDSTAFVSNSNLKSAGIYDSLTWTFNTTPASLQNFTEDFANCGTNLLGIFTQQSLEGNAEFFCDSYQDSAATFNPPYVTINGGTGSESFLNEDYLVTAVPVDITALNVKTVNLYYAEKRRFGGDGVKRGIYYSQDYTGNASTATWIAINDSLDLPTPTGTFLRRSNNITSKVDVTKPFYLAFKYESIADTTNRNWSWSLDNIELEVIEQDSSININPIAKNDVHVSVIGVAKTNEIKVRVAALENLEATFSIFDMNGRQILVDNTAIKMGTQLLTINNVNLNTGMYVLRLNTKLGAKSVKFVVE